MKEGLSPKDAQQLVVTLLVHIQSIQTSNKNNVKQKHVEEFKIHLVAWD